MTDLTGVERALDAIQAEIARGNHQRHQWASETLRLLRSGTQPGLSNPVQRLERIADAHKQDTGPGGLTSGQCIECGCPWPCPTRVWATTARDPLLSPWEPDHDEH